MAAGAGVVPHGLPLRVMTGVAVASVAALLAAVIWLAEPDPEPDPGPVDVVRVGVVEGQSVPGYLRSSRGELAAMARSAGAGDTWALITLQSYLAPDRLAPLLTGVAVAQVYARAPLSGAPTQVVRIPAYRIPDDVLSGMAAAAARREQERADYRQLSSRLSGSGQDTIRLRRAYESAAQVAGEEATAYRTHCSCVFAAVVRATPAGLSAIAGRAGVRAVDPAPEVSRLDRAEFRPPLPEQRTTVPPETRTATTSAQPAASPVAPAASAPLPSSLGTPVTPASTDEPRARSGRSVPASEDHAAVPSGPTPSRVPVPRPRRPALPGVNSVVGGRSSARRRVRRTTG
jgi:hypothetical protein